MRNFWKAATVVAGILASALVGGAFANAQGEQGGGWQPAGSGIVEGQNAATRPFDRDRTMAWFTDGRRVIACSAAAGEPSIRCTAARNLP